MQKQVLIDTLIDIWQTKELIKPLPAEGKSMYPLIKEGDTVNIKFCQPDKIRPGDIAAFKRGNTTVVHRIIKEIDKDTYLEKGDFQLRGFPVQKTRILGKVLIGNNAINKIMLFLSRLVYVTGRNRITGKMMLILPVAINYIFAIIRNYGKR